MCLRLKHFVYYYPCLFLAVALCGGTDEKGLYLSLAYELLLIFKTQWVHYSMFRYYNSRLLLLSVPEVLHQAAMATLMIA